MIFFFFPHLETFLTRWGKTKKINSRLLIHFQCSPGPSLVLFVSWGEHGSIFQGHNSNSAPIQALILLGESWVSPPPPVIDQICDIGSIPLRFEGQWLSAVSLRTHSSQTLTLYSPTARLAPFSPFENCIFVFVTVTIFLQHMICDTQFAHAGFPQKVNKLQHCTFTFLGFLTYFIGTLISHHLRGSI